MRSDEDDNVKIAAKRLNKLLDDMSLLVANAKEKSGTASKCLLYDRVMCMIQNFQADNSLQVLLYTDFASDGAWKKKDRKFK